MALHAELLENIPQTRYLSAERYMQYRSIMRLFFLAHQRMHYQMDKNAILSQLRRRRFLPNTRLSSLPWIWTSW